MSFSFRAAVEKPSQVKDAIEDRRKEQDRALGPASKGDEATERRRAELDALTPAAAKALEAAVRALPGRSAYRLSVSGHRDTDGSESISLSVTSTPAG